ncbi:MAG: nucleotidyltransferase domain-containing protein [Clostridia bacterium]|nr:nucleotidyltransferase domain-containing protein [Clostridia bacterium]
MIGIEALAAIKDQSSVDNIRQLTNCLVSQVKPLKVILFGSFADGSYTDESDYDFYLVVDDGRSVSKATDEAYNSVMYVKNRPVDIVVGTNSRFEAKGKSKHSLMIEGEVQRKGILLYDQASIPVQGRMYS